MTTNKPEVKRYDCTSGGAQYCYGCYTMEEDELGDYVEWEAYEALQAECEKLRKDAERYRWLRGECKKPNGGLTIASVTEWGLEGWSGDDPDDRIDAAMKAKLNKKRQEGRGGWQSMTAEQLSALLHEHVRKGDPVDVANLAMMLHQNGRLIEQQPSPDVLGLAEALERLVGDVERATHVEFGGTPWLKEKMAEIDYARAALAAYRKGGEK